MGVITNSVRRLRKVRFGRQSVNETLVAWVFILPSLIGLLAFSVLPTVRGILLSFTNSDLLTRQDFIGLKNYQNLIVDKQFWQSLGITLEYVLLNIPFQTFLGLVLAVMMARLTKSIFVRGIVLVPYVLPMIIATMVWMTMMDYSFGPMDYFLNLLNLPKLAFLNRDLAITSLAWINTWRHVGYVTLLLFAGLQAIPKDVYEAAAIDGANEFQLFTSVTLPLLRPVLAYVLVTSTVGAFQVWDSVAVFAVPTGGPGSATRVIFWYITKLAFASFNLGYAATVAVGLFIICLVLAIIQMRVLRADSSDLG
jgi:multiple sugar transport system permease protein